MTSLTNDSYDSREDPKAKAMYTSKKRISTDVEIHFFTLAIVLIVPSDCFIEILKALARSSFDVLEGSENSFIKLFASVAVLTA
jgi:hypothetical protein